MKVREPQAWYLPMSVLLLGVLSTVMLIGINHVNERLFTNSVLADVVMDMQIHNATAHLWLEEAITGDSNVTMGQIETYLSLAEDKIRALINGGKTNHGLIVDRPEDQRIQYMGAELWELFRDLRRIALERYRAPSLAGIGSELDQQFDSVFEAVQQKALSLERMIEDEQVRIRAWSRSLFFSILLAWVLLLAVSIGGLWVRERRRFETDRALKAANAELQIKTEELNRHRNNLKELVEQRTMQLTVTNQELQNEIVERIKAEENIRVYEEVTRNMPVGLYVWQTENGAKPSAFKLVATNPAASQIVDIENGDLLGKTMGEIFRSLEGTGLYRLIREVCNSGRMKNLEKVPYGDEPVAENFFAVKVFPLPKNYLGMLLENITEKVRMEAEAIRASHLAALGELAAGVGHEINNPVNGVINCAQILADDFIKKKEDPDIPNRIVKEGRRIATIVKSLLTFAREMDKRREPVRVQDLLADAIELTAAQLKKDGIQLNLDTNGNLPKIIAHSQQIEQVFLNLINNARYALNHRYPLRDERKVLKIEARPTTLDGSLHVKVSFVDSGVGIPANILDKVIQPFFSTKPMGVGTGLGLSISHGIVTDHGGKLRIYSQEGEYTRVEVLLPAKE